TVTGSTACISIVISTSRHGRTLSESISDMSSGDVATFSNLSIDRAGTGYTLAATSAGLTGATSTTFNITVGPAAKLAFTTQPSKIGRASCRKRAGKAIVEDAWRD